MWAVQAANVRSLSIDETHPLQSLSVSVLRHPESVVVEPFCGARLARRLFPMTYRFRFPVLLALASLAAFEAPSDAQTANRPAPARPRAAAPAQLSPANLAAILANAERTQQSDSLLLAYGQAVTDPTLARVAIGQLLSNYYQLRNQRKPPIKRLRQSPKRAFGFRFCSLRRIRF
jgi:hypothetical protein